MNTLTWTSMQLTCILLTPPATKARLLPSDPTCRCLPGESMCYTPPPLSAKPPAALLHNPTYLQMAVFPGTMHALTVHTPVLMGLTHMHFHKNIHTYIRTDSKWRLDLWGEQGKHMAKHQHAQNETHSIYHSNVMPALSAWDCLFTRTQFLPVSHTRRYTKCRDMTFNNQR